MPATTVHQFRNALAAHLPDGGVSGKAPGAPRPLGVPVHLVPRHGIVNQVRRTVRHGRPVRFRMGHEGEPGVIRNVEPLVSIGRPGVGQFHPFQEVPVARTGGGPESKCAVHVHPGSLLLGHWNYRAVVVVASQVHIARLQQDNGWAAGVRAQDAALSTAGVIRAWSSNCISTM